MRRRRRNAAALALLTTSFVAALAAQPAGAFQLGVDPANSSLKPAFAGLFSTGLKASNARVSRTLVSWMHVAPTKPKSPSSPSDSAYRWTELDSFVRITSSAGVQPLLAFYNAPAWAEGRRRSRTVRPGSWMPNPSQFGLFMRAVATRYAGNTPDPLGPAGRKLPKVSLFQGWNEPNYQHYLTPRSTAVEQVRSLQNQAYNNIKSVNPGATVALGGLGPYGSTTARIEIQPQAFLMSLLCLSGSWRLPVARGCPVKASFDAVDFHPYTWFGTPTTRAVSPEGGALGNAPDFRKLLDAAVKYGNVVPSGPKQLWTTEFGWLTNPPGHRLSRTRVVGLSPVTAAAYTAESIYRLWSWKVDLALWQSLVDVLDPAPTTRHDNNWPGGLYEYNSLSGTPRPKLTLTALAFPVFASQGTLWALSPCKGGLARVTFQQRTNAISTWVNAATVIPNADGIALTSWTKPATSTLVRALATGPSCSATSMSVGIAAR